MSTSAQNPTSIRTHFKTPEGRYQCIREKTYNGLVQYSTFKGTSKITLAYLKDKPQPAPPAAAQSTASRYLPARLSWGGSGNGASRMVGFGSSTPGLSSKLVRSNSGGGRASLASSGGAGAASGSSNSTTTTTTTTPSSSSDIEGTYLIFNVGDHFLVADYLSKDKEPIKVIGFQGTHSLCHAFDRESKDGHDLLIGTSSGDIYTASLRVQLQDPTRKLNGANHYNKDGIVTNSRCTAVAWVPGGEGQFIAAHADGNLFLYDKASTRDGSGDVTFPAHKDSYHSGVTHARSSKSNPLTRWHICDGGAINDVKFSPDGTHIATVGRDGYLRVFDWSKETLVCGFKIYYGAALCCAFSPDGKYVLIGGEDDLVHVWSMEDELVVAWCEGHSSWGGPASYRFGSVAQDTQLLLWDLSLDEVVEPLRRLSSAAGAGAGNGFAPAAAAAAANNSHMPAASSAAATGSGSSSSSSKEKHAGGFSSSSTAGGDAAHPPPPPSSARAAGGPHGHHGSLQPPVYRKDVPKISPIMAHRIHIEPLSDLLFTRDSLVTICHEGQVKVWLRPIHEAPVKPYVNANFVSSENPKVVDVSLDEDFEKALKDAEGRAISPAVDGLSVEYPDVSIIKVDIDEEGLQKTVTGAKVNAVPTFQFHKLGKVVAEVAGADRARLRELIDALHKD
eukprot:jgi/Mesen1/1776/ME000014S01186